jgi:hypothetical protein
MQQGAAIVTGRKLVMPSLAGQQWPSPAFAPMHVRATVRPLAIAVVIVSMQQGPEGVSVLRIMSTTFKLSMISGSSAARIPYRTSCKIPHL